MRRALMIVAAIVLVACSTSGEGRPEVTDARMGEPAGPHGAVYMTIHAYGSLDRLIGATTDVAQSVELHETRVVDGMTAMRPVVYFDLLTGGTLELEPGGSHLMLVDVDRLQSGDTFEVTLAFEVAGLVTVEVKVVDPADVLPDEEHDHDG